mgnify:CR=1 FL=1
MYQLLKHASQIIPQALCSKYGLAIGANLIWMVRILMVICFPVAYPVAKVNHLCFSSLGKVLIFLNIYHWWIQLGEYKYQPNCLPLFQLLDLLLGHSTAGMFRRAQLKALVSIHGEKVSRTSFILLWVDTWRLKVIYDLLC